MNSANAILVALSTTVGLVACGSSSDESSTDVTQWLGESPHLAITGTLGTVIESSPNLKFDVHLEGDQASGVYCHRFYAPMGGADANGQYDPNQVYFAMKELGGIIEVGGQQKEFTIAYWRHDVPAGTDLRVIPRTFGTGLAEGKTWSDMNLFNPGADVLSQFESAAVSGTVSIKLNTGTPDVVMVATAPEPIRVGGSTGEFISVSWGPHDNLNISVTANCISVPVAASAWASSRILP